MSIHQDTKELIAKFLSMLCFTLFTFIPIISSAADAEADPVRLRL
ncbi:MAG: hypothetical protein IRF16MM_06600 [Candidatus Midichloria mitochondrii]